MSGRERIRSLLDLQNPPKHDRAAATERGTDKPRVPPNIQRLLDIQKDPVERQLQVGDRLPRPEQAEIPTAKFARYSMDPTNPRSRGKPKAWEALGYDISTPDARERSAADVIDKLRDGLHDSPIVETRDTPDGYRVRTRTRFTGPNGRDATLVAAWQRDPGADRYRLLTPWAEVHREDRQR
jgi:hypothetical protein